MENLSKEQLSAGKSAYWYLLQAADSVRREPKNVQAPDLRSRAAQSIVKPLLRPHLASPELMNWSITT